MVWTAFRLGAPGNEMRTTSPSRSTIDSGLTSVWVAGSANLEVSQPVMPKNNASTRALAPANFAIRINNSRLRLVLLSIFATAFFDIFPPDVEMGWPQIHGSRILQLPMPASQNLPVSDFVSRFELKLSTPGQHSAEPSAHSRHHLLELAHFLHHLLHLRKFVEHGIQFGDRNAASFGDALTALRIEQVRIAPLLEGHRANHRFHMAEFFFLFAEIGSFERLGAAGQQTDQR